jgi:hypothetical protein
MIDDKSFRTSLWTSVKNNILSTLTEETITASVEASYNDKKLAKPIIVIDPVIVSEGGFSFGGVNGRRGVTAPVHIYAGTGYEVDTLGELLVHGFKARPIQGLVLSTIEDSYDYEEVSGNKVHLLSLSMGFIRE